MKLKAKRYNYPASAILPFGTTTLSSTASPTSSFITQPSSEDGGDWSSWKVILILFFAFGVPLIIYKIARHQPQFLRACWDKIKAGAHAVGVAAVSFASTFSIRRWRGQA